ncbi:hypothetical protein [Geodermatophilus sp. FMUSA9-8]|uniref:hypothetical protein n=1 Tax=Geodermatophilus sp. FMUSA9-8 TaxID=3120155 RepID=UPI00300AEF75
MTHSIDAPLPPPPSSGATGYGDTSTTSTTTSGSPSTTDVAKDEARNVGQTAKQAGSQVASTAADQAKNVVAETKQQAQSLVEQGRTQVRQQAVSQQQKAGQSLAGLAEQLRNMVEGNAPAPGPARDLITEGAGRVQQFADVLQNCEPADLLEDVRSFARRKPGVFLLGAALAGVVAGRLTSGVKAAHTDDSSSRQGLSSTTSTYGSGNYVDPAPAYSGYETTTTTGYQTTGAGYGTTTGYESTGYESTTGYETTGTTGTPLPPPPYGTVPPEGSVVPPAAPAGWDDPTRRPGQGV